MLKSGYCPADNTISKKVINPRLEFIDALRGIGALMVIAFHVLLLPSPQLELPSYLGIIGTHFGFGVTLFFVVSAFTLCMSSDNRSLELNKTVKFYMRRFFRIAPLFYAMLLFWMIARMIIWSRITPWPEFLANFTFTYNFFPPFHQSIVWAGWTIGVEMVFYACFPIIWKVVKGMRGALVLFVALCLVALVAKHMLTALPDLPGGYTYKFFLYQAPVFAVGVVSYFVYKYFNEKLDLMLPRKYVALPLTGLLVLLTISLLANQSLIVFLRSYSLYHYLWAINFGVLLNCLAVYSYGVFVNRFTCFYGKVSYSTYLIHPFLVWALVPVYRSIYETFPWSSALSFFACLMLTLAILTPLSLLSFTFIEQAGSKFGRSLIAKV
jgi:peptidoglycan/LPS O-acetylase OafA/YrhL